MLPRRSNRPSRNKQRIESLSEVDIGDENCDVIESFSERNKRVLGDLLLNRSK